MSTPLRAEPSPTISTVNLIITAVSLVATLPTLLPQPLHPRLTTFLRLIHTLILLSPAALSLYTLTDLLTDPLTTLSTHSANVPLFNILNRTAATFNATPGFSEFLLAPRSGDVDTSVAPHVAIVCISVISAFVITFRRTAVRRQASLLAFAVTTAYVLGSLLTAFQPGSLPRDSSVLRDSWLDKRFTDVDSVNETRFLSSVWLRDFVTADSMSDDTNLTNALDRKGFRDSFCDNFNNLRIQAGLVVDVVDGDGIPITTPPRTTASSASTSASGSSTTGASTPAATTTAAKTTAAKTTAATTTATDEDDEEENDRPRPAVRQAIPPIRQSTDELVITRNLLSQILVVYTVGKPLFTTYGKSLSLLSLPFLTLSPVFVAYATRSGVLYPFIVGWVGLLLLLIVYATPESLRWVGVGFQSSDLVVFCGRRYQVLVTDDVTHRIGVFDMVSFALIVITAVLQGFRWMRVRVVEEEEEEEGEVKMMGYDEVYSENGALRW